MLTSFKAMLSLRCNYNSKPKTVNLFFQHSNQLCEAARASKASATSSSQAPYPSIFRQSSGMMFCTTWVYPFWFGLPPKLGDFKVFRYFSKHELLAIIKAGRGNLRFLIDLKVMSIQSVYFSSLFSWGQNG